MTSKGGIETQGIIKFCIHCRYSSSGTYKMLQDTPLKMLYLQFEPLFGVVTLKKAEHRYRMTKEMEEEGLNATSLTLYMHAAHYRYMKTFF